MIKKIIMAILYMTLLQSVFSEEPLQSGISAFNKMDYRRAALYFRQALEAESKDTEQKKILLWLGKTEFLMADMDAAETSLRKARELPGSEGSEEILYYLGRTLLSGSGYSEGIQILMTLGDKKDSPFAPQSLFWIAEFWFDKADLMKAESLYSRIRNEYPGSSRSEAAGYRLTIIELMERESRLLSLLKWSHEQQILSERRFLEKEADYQDRLDQYRKKLKDNSAMGTGFYNTDALLAFKARALVLKSFYLGEYEQTLSGDTP